jgi:hypothetical protein
VKLKIAFTTERALTIARSESLRNIAESTMISSSIQAERPQNFEGTQQGVFFHLCDFVIAELLVAVVAIKLRQARVGVHAK